MACRKASVLISLALAGGCAEEGPYPSLAPRPVEKALAEADVERPLPPLPDDPRLAEQVAALVAGARQGEAEFAAALPVAAGAVARAGGAGSESWVDAQQALSRAEAARATTVQALAELDALALAEANRRALSASDLERLAAATASVQALADRQHERLRALQASLSAL
jgi:hypothetical protein